MVLKVILTNLTTRDLLLNNLPRTIEPLNENADLLEKSIEWSKKLDFSYLPIQGPPGKVKVILQAI